MKIKPSYSLKNFSRAGKVPEFSFNFPDNFVLVIDTREQNPLFQKPPKGLFIVRNTLTVGDYSVLGFENEVSIERKSVLDLLSSLGKNRDRFKEELMILKDYKLKWLVIEGSEDDVLSFHIESLMHPNSVRQSLASIEVRLGIPIYYEPKREKMERWILDRLIKIYRIRRQNGEG